MPSSSLPPQKQMTGMLGHPVAENPIDLVFDAVYAHYSLPWTFRKCDVGDAGATRHAAVRVVDRRLARRAGVPARVSAALGE